MLNAIELDITSAQVEGDSGPARQATITLDPALQRCHLTFTTPLSPGTWKLTMAFQGTLNDKLRAKDSLVSKWLAEKLEPELGGWSR